MSNGRNWITNPPDTSWEATHFDYIFVNKLDTALVSGYKKYNPNIKVLQYMLGQTWIDNELAWDTLVSWCNQNGKNIEDMLIHLKYNALYGVFEPTASPDISNPQLILGWDTLNDVNENGIRDYPCACSVSTTHGAGIFSDTFQNFTPNGLIGKGIYNYYGGFCGLGVEFWVER